ncbi:MAG: putative manganese-dependent inorganic diphosphatase [Spirochaetales bacterium]|nr:putative manganese-dependent inorganic diphosphatase [Spirochaetales bacterium]
MSKVYITGHKNPDMDSICSAYMYAQLKNKVDHSHEYIPIRCGGLNSQSKSLFERLGLTPPLLMKDVYPKVVDILQPDIATLCESDPVFMAMDKILDFTVSILPVLSQDGSYKGLVSINEISDFFISEHKTNRPMYDVYVNNFEKVLSGVFYKRSVKERFTAPVMVGAMPYDISIKRIEELGGTRPLLIVGQRIDMLEYAVKHDFPAIILTGVETPEDISFDFSTYGGTVFLSAHDTAETTRLLRLSTPVSSIMKKEYPQISEEALFDDAKKMLLGSELRGLPVFSKGKFSGIVSRRSFIEKPKKKLILVDHNEASQSVMGIESAEILEILDHHRFGADSTRNPIYIAAKPVGSTCTIVYQHFKQAGIDPGKDGAALLLAGILADTILLKSPTATDQDWAAINELAPRAGLDWQEFGRELFSNVSVLSNNDSSKVVNQDLKLYSEFGVKFGIGQVEVVTLDNISEFKESLLAALEKVRVEKALDWTMLLVTDVMKEESLLLSTEYSKVTEKFLYKKNDDSEFYLPGILSRKKQLLPEVLRVLEDLN